MTTVVIGNRTYPVVTANGLYWMQQNLDFKSMNQQIGAEEYMTFNRFDSHLMYGYLYDWNTTKQIISELSGNIPSGWRLPTKIEWKDLFDSIGGDKKCAPKLRANAGLWMEKIGGVNEPGSLALLPGGFVDSSYQLNEIGRVGYFWTSTEKNTNYTYGVKIMSSSDKMTIEPININYKLSIRLVKTI